MVEHHALTAAPFSLRHLYGPAIVTFACDCDIATQFYEHRRPQLPG